MAAKGGAEVARAYVTIMPSMEGAQREISKGIADAAEKGGKSGGQRAGKQLGEGGKSGGALFSKAFETITSGKLSTTLASVGGKITSGFQSFGAKATQGFTARFPDIVSKSDDVALRVNERICGAFKGMGETIAAPFKGLASAASSSFGSVSESAKAMGGNIVASISGSRMGQAFSSVLSGAKGAFAGVAAAAGNLGANVSGVFRGVGLSASTAWSGVKSAASAAFSGIASGPVGTAVSAIGSALGKVGSVAAAAFGKVASLAASGFEKARGIASTACSAIVSALRPIGDVAKAAFSFIAVQAIDAGKQALTSYADYEQLVGGVETLFGTRGARSVEEYAQIVGKSTAEASADFESHARAEQKALQNAQKAFSTCGMSANAYMETATSFAASLVSSLGGDTEAAVRYADMAMVDMSDNANKMGSNIQSIQDAYQGFAKQNYTMLDNLNNMGALAA